ILNQIPAPGFVIKPSRSLFGKGVKVFSNNNDVLTDSADEPITCREIASGILDEREYDCLMVQERLRNHEAFSTVGNSDDLQTLRLISFVDETGRPQILASFLKLIRGKNTTDNWEGGRSGNLILSLNSESGRPEQVVLGNANTGTSTFE